MRLKVIKIKGYTPPKKRRYNCILTVFSLLKQGINPSRMLKNTDFSKRQIQYAVDKMRNMRIIRKVGYGTWEVLVDEFPEGTKYRKIHRVGRLHTPPKGTKPDSIRGHGIVATLRIPKLKNWKSRESILKSANIPFKVIPQGQRISIGDVKKVWLTNKSIVFYMPYSWYGEIVYEVAWKIMNDVIQLTQRTEKLLGISSLKRNNRYHIKFSRQHYALIKNVLAKQYHKEKKKLFVYDEKGLWLLIDNSHNLHETEGVHPVTAPSDTTKIKNWLNSLKRSPITTDFILEGFKETTKTMNQISSNQESFSESMVDYGKKISSHIKAIESLGISADSLRDGIGKLTSLVDRLNKPKKKRRNKNG